MRNYKDWTRYNKGDFREGFAELVKRRILSENQPHFQNLYISTELSWVQIATSYRNMRWPQFQLIYELFYALFPQYLTITRAI